MISYNIRLSTPDDSSLPWFDFTTMTAIVTCPRWGLIHYKEQLTTGDSNARDLPTEAGQALHSCFAADRLYHLLRVQSSDYGFFVYDRGNSIFGPERWRKLNPLLDKETPQDIVLEALYTSGYYDEGTDKVRTLSNLETVALFYLQQRDFTTQPIYVDTAKGFVGIEILIDFVVEFIDDTDGTIEALRFLGRADGVHCSGSKLIIHENKTTTMKAREWGEQWHTSHQPTGYMLYMTLATGQPVTEGLILGSKIPVPKNELEGFSPIPIIRHPRQFTEFFKWLHQGYQLYLQYKDDPWSAPMYTHSCYRYFKVCEFSPICQGSSDEFEEYREMLNPIAKPWHPHD